MVPRFLEAWLCPEVGGAALGWRCFGASDHGPVSFRRVGQSVDLPGKARRWGHDLRGSRQSGSVKPWSRPPPATTYPFSGISWLHALRAARALAGLERGGDRSAGPAGGRAARGERSEPP